MGEGDMKKVRITISFEMDDNFYAGERKTKKERIRQYEEDFSDIEIFENNIPYWGYDVKAELIEEKK